MGTWEFAETPKTSEFDCRGQNTLHWGVFYIIGKLRKRRYRKWALMNHLKIFSTSYGKKKARESNWQCDSRPLKVGNRPDPTSVRAGEMQHTIGKLSTKAISLFQTSSQSEVWANSYDPTKWRESKSGQFRDFSLGVPGQKTIRMQVLQRDAKNIIWEKVVASPKSGLW